MTSFVVNHWVTGELNNYDLKLTNLVIHIINGLLIFILCRLLMQQTTLGNKTGAVSFLIALFWLLSPVNTGTTFYIIQRAVLLSTLFSLLSLISYVASRAELNYSRLKKNILLICSILFWAAGIYSKENAVILPLYILVIEFCFFCDLKKYLVNFSKKNKIIFGSLLSVASIFVFYVLAIRGWFNYDDRTFSLTDRLYTQPVAVLTYIQQSLAPLHVDTGLYRDDFTVYSSLADPVPFLSFLFFCFLFGIGIVLFNKEKFRFLAAGIFIFFSAHIIESTIFPLEIFFLHRNYFPSFGLFLFLVPSTSLLFSKYDINKKLLYSVMIFYALFFTEHNIRQSEVYSSYDSILLNAYTRHPDSMRANLEMAGRLIAQNDLKTSLLINYNFLQNNPEKSLPAIIQRFFLYCEHGTAVPETEYSLLNRELYLNHPHSVSSSLLNLTESYIKNNCMQVNLRRIFRVFSNWIDFELLRNQYSPEQLWEIDYYIINYLFDNSEQDLARKRLQRHLHLENERAVYYRDNILPDMINTSDKK
jgi:hypothetical protein